MKTGFKTLGIRVPSSKFKENDCELYSKIVELAVTIEMKSYGNKEGGHYWRPFLCLKLNNRLSEVINLSDILRLDSFFSKNIKGFQIIIASFDFGDQLFIPYDNMIELLNEVKDALRTDRDGKIIKVFKIDDYEWWSGESLESIKKYYLKEICGDTTFEDAYEVTELDKMKIHITESLNSPQITLRETLANLIYLDTTFPAFVCGTES